MIGEERFGHDLGARRGEGAPFALDPWPREAAVWGVAVLVALASWIAQVLMTEAYGTLSVPEAAVWLQLTPIAQFALAVPLLDERPKSLAVAGAILGIAGVAYGTILGQRQPAPLEPPGGRRA